MRNRTWGLAIFILFFVVLSFNVNAYFPAEGGYCSKYNEAGDWEFLWGKHDPRMYCMLIEHRLGPKGSPIKSTSMGNFDIFDMNKIDVECTEESHSFSIEGFGEYVMSEAAQRARNLDATHCLFRVTSRYH